MTGPTPTGIWPFKDGAIWKWCLVGAPLDWPIGKPDSGLVLTIPDGFVSDLVSIPGWLHWLIDPNDPQTARASIIHDALLSQGFEQRMAAGEFYRALCEDGLARWRRIGFYLAVLLASDNWDDVLPLSI